MAVKLAPVASPHTAGIFADMTVDGPEIGTLVIVFDRAKNLPNRKSMGKQNPYCAARLGKEAKKTETDQRGGQTPRWDQEIRFTVHDSPDYHNLKISVFSEDKKTDLIGEAWVNLDQVVVRGGGRSDLWQGLNCKGKYAGELRLEMTYYDNRPKLEGTKENTAMHDEARPHGTGGSRVKRRPLPTAVPVSSITPDMIPPVAVPGRAKHGPREHRALPKTSSTAELHAPIPDPLPSSLTLRTHDPHTAMQTPEAATSTIDPNAALPSHHPQLVRDQYTGAEQSFHPETPQHDYGHSRHTQEYHMPYPTPEVASRPVSTTHDRNIPRYTYPGSYTAYDEALDERSTLAQGNVRHAPQQRGYPSHSSGHDQFQTPAWDSRDHRRPNEAVRVPDALAYPTPPSHTYDSPISEQPLPPPPPMHSNSAPAVPLAVPSYLTPQAPISRHYSTPPDSQRLHDTDAYRVDHHDGYTTSGPVTHTAYMTQNFAPNAHMHSGRYYPEDPHTRPVPGAFPGRNRTDQYHPPPEHGTTYPPPSLESRREPVSHVLSEPHRRSMGDLYADSPMSRNQARSYAMPRSQSPIPVQQYSYEPEVRGRDYPAELADPHAATVAVAAQSQVRRPKSTYSIRHPIRAFESSESSPLAYKAPKVTRKSVSPRPSFSGQDGPAIPFGPDSFDVHNPNTRPPKISPSASPYNPYQVRADGDDRELSNGPIVGWHGQEIDPSDHLPVDSWAPEPEKKIPAKTYGLGREREFGPRTVQNPLGAQGRVSKDTVVHVRPRGPPEASIANRTALPARRSYGDIDLHAGTGGRDQNSFNTADKPRTYTEYQTGRGKYDHGPHPASTHGRHAASAGTPSHEAPAIPPKVPFENYSNHVSDELSRDIASIDIGSSRYRRGGASQAAPASYVPVRSHRDRHSTYY